MTESDEEPMGDDAGPAKPDRTAASPRTAGPAAEAEAGHGREAAAGRADLAASEEANDALRSRTDGRRRTEVAIAAGVLNRMLELGRPEYVRIA